MTVKKNIHKSFTGCLLDLVIVMKEMKLWQGILMG